MECLASNRGPNAPRLVQGSTSVTTRNVESQSGPEMHRSNTGMRRMLPTLLNQIRAIRRLASVTRGRCLTTTRHVIAPINAERGVGLR